MDIITVEQLAAEIRRAVEQAAPDHETVQISLWHETPAWIKHPQYRWVGTWLPSKFRVTTHKEGGGISYGGNVLSLVYYLADCRRDPEAIAWDTLVRNVEYAIDAYVVPDEYRDDPDAEMPNPPNWVSEGVSRGFAAT